MIPWWGYWLMGMSVWLFGFVTGRAVGYATAVAQLVSKPQQSGPQDMAAMLAAAGGSRAPQRET